MRNSENLSPRKITSAYFITTISLTLVLFLLGLVGLLILNAKKLSDYVKENITLTIVIKNDVREADIFQLQKQLDALPYVKSTQYITREKAAEEFAKQLGEDFVTFLGYNPLLSNIEVKLHAQYANQAFIQLIENKVKKNEIVNEVIYEKSLIHLVNENVRKISIVILSFTGLLFLISLALINNNVRLMVYSRRFIIRTMQLVGATRSFIRRPFLYKSILQGFIASIMANALILGLIYVIDNEMKEFNLMIDWQLLYILFFIISILGIFINLVSTFFTLNKYLRISTDKLYMI